MEHTNPLWIMLVLLAAAVIAVPLFKSVRLGAILGYLVAGIILGPTVLAVFSEPNDVLHFAEIGVVLLLFIIGLELEPERLWSMRRQIIGLGSTQVFISTLIVIIFGWIVFQQWSVSIIIGLAIALSSTAFAIQLMAERGLLGTQSGRRGFSVLLFQDLAVIPILFIVSLFGVDDGSTAHPWYWSLLSVVLLLAVGKFLLLPGLSLISRFGSRETMTAASLLIVVGSAYLMYAAGLSMGMGAFIAGLLLANSHFRHQLEADVEPFKGLTLGLFFMAIGMTLDVQELLRSPLLYVALALTLMFVKAGIITALFKAAGLGTRQSIKIGLMLSQGGEFAFVIMSQSVGIGAIDPALANQVNLVVGLSMALTGPLVSFYEWLDRKPTKSTSDQSENWETSPEVVLLGFGRFAQTTGRILAANKIPFTAIDKDAEHIDFVKRFGNRVYFGDATRLDILQSAGLDKARVVLIAIDETGQAESVVRLIKENFPKIKVVARARNRSAYWALKAAGADSVIREVYESSLLAAQQTLSAIGYSSSEASRATERFDEHDQQMIESTFEHRDDLEQLIAMGRQGRSDLERIFDQDSGHKK